MTISKIALGSESPIKLRALRSACALLGCDALIAGCKAPSNVPEQPFGAETTAQGALNRARFTARQHEDADLVVAIESGLVQDDGWQDVAYAVVIDKSGQASRTQSAGFRIPDWMVDQVRREGTDLGVVIQRLAGGGDKDPQAFITQGRLTREATLVPLLAAALAPYVFPGEYR